MAKVGSAIATTGAGDTIAFPGNYMPGAVAPTLMQSLAMMTLRGKKTAPTEPSASAQGKTPIPEGTLIGDSTGALGPGLFPAQYGYFNFAGANWMKVSRYLVATMSQKNKVYSLNAGAVWSRPKTNVGGVLAGDTGLMPSYGYLPGHRAPWRGVVFALTPVKETSQTILSQFAATPNGYTGDAPGDLQQTVTNPPPWRRYAARGDSRGAFRSGIMQGLRV